MKAFSFNVLDSKLYNKIAILVNLAISKFVILFIVALLTFFVLRLIPGDPVDFMLGGENDPDVAARLRHELALDRSIPFQFVSWLRRIIVGDWGYSYIIGNDVIDLVFDAIQVTLSLTILAFVGSVSMALIIGLICAYFRGRWIDISFSMISAMGYAAPSFWIGILLAWLLGEKLGLFPVIGYTPFFQDPIQSVYHLVLPVITLTIYYGGLMSRVVRSTVIETMQQDFILAAKLRGVTGWRLLFGHILPYSAVPILTIAGLTLGQLFGGAVLTETVFSLPGIGRLMTDAIIHRDYLVVQGSILLTGTLFIIINAVVDALYAYLDPRINQRLYVD
ncbi:MAG: ABC transporter permease [Methylococcales bacterium]|nr:ABC transporter permease [Methylococcales bacterium]